MKRFKKTVSVITAFIVVVTTFVISVAARYPVPSQETFSVGPYTASAYLFTNGSTANASTSINVQNASVVVSIQGHYRDSDGYSRTVTSGNGGSNAASAGVNSGIYFLSYSTSQHRANYGSYSGSTALTN